MGLTEDLAAIFADTGPTVPVVFGAQSTRGFLSSDDVPENDGQGGIMMVRRRRVIVRDGSLTGLASNLTITVDGTAYTIHGAPQSSGRGKTTLILAEGP